MEEMRSFGYICPHCGKSTGFDKETDTLDG